ncbi:MAG: DUF5658 family protein [Planctomycetota bacterium]
MTDRRGPADDEAADEPLRTVDASDRDPSDGRLEDAFRPQISRGRGGGLRAPLWEVQYVSETRLYLLVSLADLVITVFLLRTGGIREANPVAVAVIASFGSRGLVAFKFGLVAFVCVLAQAIGRRDYGRGELVMKAAAAVTACVAAYGFSLAWPRL